jgi:alcohol dehydrogenase (NADP+)
MVQSAGYASLSAGTPLAPFSFTRRDPKPNDVVVSILHCGICHSDLHYADNDMGMSKFPAVTGHEIVGRVAAVGKDVKKFAIGDIAAIGCYYDSCRVCSSCRGGNEHMCLEGFTGAFGGLERDGEQKTWGGFSNNYVADEGYVYTVPKNLDPAAAAPLLCAGITTYSPLRKWKVGPGMRVGIVGVGGLGHMAIKLAVAMGAEVLAFTSSQNKVSDARALGAHEAIVSSDAHQMRHRSAGGLDFVLDTVSAPHDINAYLGLLKPNSTMCLLGLVPELKVSPIGMVFGQKSLTGSLIGGVKETQDMLNFCGKHNITADIERISLPQINEGFARLRRNDVKYRFVVDMPLAI